MRAVFRKLGEVLDRLQLREVGVLLALMLVGMVLETLGVGLVVPVLALITDPGMVARYPMIQRVVGFFVIP